MNIRETKKMTIRFDEEDIYIIRRLVREQVGKMTISKILDQMSCVFDWYTSLMSMLGKIRVGWYVELNHDEINVLVTLLSKAYNSDTETEKEAIKAIADAVDAVKNC